jgi:hypothetical protein
VVGTEVIWEVVSGGHTITQCDETYTTCPPPGGFDLGVVYAYELRFRTFNTPGVYEYRCNFHPTQMRGRIIVTVAQTPTPSATPIPTAIPTAAPTSTAAPTQPAATQGAIATVASRAAPARVPYSGDSPKGGMTPWSLPAVAVGLTLIAAGAIVTRGRAGR